MIRYIKHLNESFSAIDDKIQYYIDALHINLDSDRPIDLNNLSDEEEILTEEFSANDRFICCYNTTVDIIDRSSIPIKLSNSDLLYILEPMKK